MNRYFYLNRPPQYGHQPDGFAHYEGGVPSKSWPTADGKNLWAYGWVEYPQPLPAEQIWKWDLWPDNPTEVVHYQFWQQADRDPELAQFLEDDITHYWLNDPEAFKRYQSQEMIDAVQLLVAEKQS